MDRAPAQREKKRWSGAVCGWMGLGLLACGVLSVTAVVVSFLAEPVQRGVYFSTPQSIWRWRRVECSLSRGAMVIRANDDWWDLPISKACYGEPLRFNVEWDKDGIVEANIPVWPAPLVFVLAGCGVLWCGGARDGRRARLLERRMGARRVLVGAALVGACLSLGAAVGLSFAVDDEVSNYWLGPGPDSFHAFKWSIRRGTAMLSFGSELGVVAADTCDAHPDRLAGFWIDDRPRVFSVGGPLWLAPVLLAGGGVWPWTRGLRALAWERSGRCGRCGYPSAGDVCTECGLPRVVDC